MSITDRDERAVVPVEGDPPAPLAGGSAAHGGPSGSRRLARLVPALVSVAVSSIAWLLASVTWWRRGLPNLWGPRPTAALPLANAATI